MSNHFLLTSRTVQLTDETTLTASVMCFHASFILRPNYPVCTLENKMLHFERTSDIKTSISASEKFFFFIRGINTFLYVHVPPIYKILEFINIHMFNYQIGRLRSICESRGEFLGRSGLCANY